MKYKVQIKPSAKKQLAKIDKKQARRISEKLVLLAEDPYPVTSKPLKGRNDRSMRVGNYRVLYDVHEKEIIVLILVIAHRKEVYRK